MLSVGVTVTQWKLGTQYLSKVKILANKMKIQWLLFIGFFVNFKTMLQIWIFYNFCGSLKKPHLLLCNIYTYIDIHVGFFPFHKIPDCDLHCLRDLEIDAFGRSTDEGSGFPSNRNFMWKLFKYILVFLFPVYALLSVLVSAHYTINPLEHYSQNICNANMQNTPFPWKSPAPLRSSSNKLK